MVTVGQKTTAKSLGPFDRKRVKSASVLSFEVKCLGNQLLVTGTSSVFGGKIGFFNLLFSAHLGLLKELEFPSCRSPMAR